MAGVVHQKNHVPPSTGAKYPIKRHDLATSVVIDHKKGRIQLLLGLSIYLEHPLHSEVPRAEIKP